MAAAKLNRPQIDRLLELYADESPEAARKLAMSWGMAPRYVSKLASMHGIRAKRTRYHPGFGRDQDPRWERAKAIGMVVA